MLGEEINKFAEDAIKIKDEIKKKVYIIFKQEFKDVIDTDDFEAKWCYNQGKIFDNGIPSILNIARKDVCYTENIITIYYDKHEINYNIKDIKSNNMGYLSAIQNFNNIIMQEQNKELKEKYGYIYRIVCRENNKSYIGQHKSDKFDIHYKGSGKALYDKYISLGIADKYKGKVDRDGFDQHFYIELIDWGYSQDELNEMEEYYIKEYDTINNGYNIAFGGNGGDNNNNIKKVILCLDPDDDVILKVYESLASTKKDGFDPSSISKVCRGERKTHKGFKWCYKDENDL